MKRKILLGLTLLFLLVTLTACNKKFTVSFDTQGGSAIESVEVKKNKTVERPSDPVKEGFVFVEWQLDGVAYDFDSKVKGDITLVAKWEESSSSVKKLSQPKNVKVVENRVSWEAVEGAESYEVYVDGTKHEVNTNALEVNAADLTIASIYVVAKNSKASSEKSETLVYEKKYSDSELEELLGADIISEIEQAPEQKEYFNRIALCTVKYNFSIAELSQMESPLELLAYIEEGRTKDLLAFFLMYIDTFLELNMNSDMGEEMVCPVTDEQIQTFYELLKSLNGYASNYENAKDDARFMNLVLPVLCEPAYNNHSVQSLIGDITQTDSYSNTYYEVRRNGLNFVFTNKYLNVEYTMTYDELNSLLEFYDEIGKLEMMGSVISEVASQYSNYFVSKIRMSILEEGLAIASANFEEFYAYVEENVDSLAAIIEKLYNSYLTVMGYEEKVNELMEKFNTIESEEQLTAVLTDARNFALQVIDLLRDTLPTQAEVEELGELIKVLDFSELVLPNIADENVDVIAKSISMVIDGVKQMLAAIETITVEDIEKLLPVMSGAITEEAIAVVEKVLTGIINKVKESEQVKNYDLADLFDLIESVLKVGNMDIKSQLSILFNTQLTEAEYKVIEAELKSIIQYIEAYDTADLEAILDAYFEGEIDFLQFIYEIFDLVDYLVDYSSANLITKYEAYFKGVFEMNYREDDPELATKLFNALVANYNNYKPYIKASIKAGVGMAFGEMPGFEKEMVLSIQLMAIQDSFTNASAVAFVNAYNAIGEATGMYPAQEFALFNENFEANIERLMSLIGKHEIEWTENDNLLVEELEDHFPIDWPTLNLFEAVHNTSNNTIDLVVKEEYRDLFTELTSMSCTDLEVGVTSYNGYGYGIEVEYIISEEQFVLCQISIESIQMALLESYPTYDVFKIEECELYICNGYTDMYGQEHLWTESLFNIDLTDFVEMIYSYEAPLE